MIQYNAYNKENCVLVGWLERILVSPSYPDIIGETFSLTSNGKLRKFSPLEATDERIWPHVSIWLRGEECAQPQLQSRLHLQEVA